MDRRDFIKTSICAVAITTLGIKMSDDKYPDVKGVMAKHLQRLINESAINDKVARETWSTGVATDIKNLGYSDDSFMIICDETNNPPVLVDSNGFFGSVLMRGDTAWPNGEHRRLDISVNA